MNITDVLFMRKTCKVVPTADVADIALGLKLHERDYGIVEKTVTGNPITITDSAKAQNAISCTEGSLAVFYPTK